MSKNWRSRYALCTLGLILLWAAPSKPKSEIQARLMVW